MSPTGKHVALITGVTGQDMKSAERDDLVKGSGYAAYDHYE